jgi:hypothetical protein
VAANLPLPPMLLARPYDALPAAGSTAARSAVDLTAYKRERGIL